MDRQNLISRLVELKLASGNKGKVFCVCMARLNQAAPKK